MTFISLHVVDVIQQLEIGRAQLFTKPHTPLGVITLVVFVIRTFGNPLRSRPSAGLAITATAVTACAFLLPYTPLAVPLGFTSLPFLYVAFVAIATVTYLGLVEVIKRQVVRRLR